jgi:hypothetical protein
MGGIVLQPLLYVENNLEKFSESDAIHKNWFTSARARTPRGIYDFVGGLQDLWLS